VGDIPTEEMIAEGVRCAVNYAKRIAGRETKPEWGSYVRDLYLAMRAVEPDGWEPIETAPKDGAEVLLFDPKHREQFVAFPGPDGEWVFAAREHGPRFIVKNPTHWRPLPPSPEGV
jgi:hypothetical protein